ncbi:L,D-transpeptidase family protein [Roseateles sp. P5_E7]
MPVLSPSALKAAAALLCGACIALPGVAATHADRTASPTTLEALNAASLLPGHGHAVGAHAIARAQVLLDRAWFSPGEIDGHQGRNLQRALTAFQRASGLKATGRLDVATAKALEQGDTGDAFTTYTITDKDVAGPYTRTPADMADRATLKSLDYETIGEALAERFHLSESMLASLNRHRAKDFKAGDKLIVPDVTARPPAEGAARRIEVEKRAKTLWVLGADRKVLGAFPISIGGPQDPLPLGVLKIVSEVPNPTFTYNPALLKHAPKNAQKAEVAPGPNNPVGNTWLGLSKPHWGIHGTPNPAQLGREETNGCIHMTNWDAQRLAKLVKPGFEVDIRP